jgi:hypothetical protein
MIRHLALGATPKERSTKIGPLLRLEKIKFGGYRRDKIYGTLTCSASKRMKVESRVFFQDENIGNVSIRWNGLRVVQPMTLITSGLSTSDTGLGVFHPCHGWPFILKEAKNC